MHIENALWEEEANSMSDVRSTKPKSLKSLFGNIFLLAMSTVFAYGIGEVVVRVFFPQPMLPRYVMSAPYGIRKNMPNLSIWHTSLDYKVNVRTNSRGVRTDREIPYEKPPGVFRIVGLGDSFTLGYEVDVNDTYLNQLEVALRAKGYSQVEVVNLAVSGFGTAEELITLREEGFKYSPDMVILGYFINDIDNNMTSHLFELRGNELHRAADTYLPAVGIRQALYDIPGYRFLAENSQLLNIFRNKLSYLVTKDIKEHNMREEAQKLGIPIPDDPALLDSVMASYASNLTARLLDEIYLDCARRQIPLMILNIPDASQTAGRINSNLPLDKMHYGDKVICVDAARIVSPYFGKQEIQWERWHGHWKPWVHHLVAKVLADTIAPYLAQIGHPKGSIALGERNQPAKGAHSSGVIAGIHRRSPVSRNLR